MTIDKLLCSTDNWNSVSPEKVGLKPNAITLLEKEIQTRNKHINGILLVKDGHIAYEKYFNGYAASDFHNVASITKSIVSALIGIAIDKGFIESIDQKILDFFPEYKQKNNDLRKSVISIKHILTMTAPTMLKSSRSGNEALDRLRRQKNWVNFILDQLGKTRRPESFYYSTSNTHLLSAIISNTTGMSCREFANKHLFTPIGIKEIPEPEMNSFSLENVFGKNVSGWIRDPQGYTTGGWGLNLKLRDMARFGLLYLNKGNWNKKQIIPESWVTISTENLLNDYGYLWWIFNQENQKVFAALGTGGNAIWCIPQNNMVVAVAAKLARRFPDPWKLVKDHILTFVE